MRSSVVVGGAGFIGSALVHHLCSVGGVKLTVLDNLSMGNGLANYPCKSRPVLQVGNAHQIETLEALLDVARPNVIYHFAANSDISKSAADAEADLRDTLSTTSALAFALARNPRPDLTLVFSSTSAVYGDHLGEITLSSRKAPASAYGWMKLASERLLAQLLEVRAFGKLVVVRFPNVTGKGQTHGVVKDLVARYVSEEPWSVLGDGSQDKPYLHVDDLVGVLANLEVVFPGLGYHEINISPDSSTRVSKIVEMIEERGGRNRRPVFGSSPQGWPGDVTKYAYDTSELRRLGITLPSSDDAIRKSIDEEFQSHGH